MIEIKEKKDCCGCNACYSICPKQCIEMKEDKEGFKYPEVNKSTCIKCNLCVKVCPILNELDRKIESKFYACINKDEEIRMKSSSGGVFSLLAEEVIKNKGYVYGATLDENLKVKHIEVSKKEDIEKLRGSKYVQSDIENTYKLARKRLDNGKKVLFSGTQCQIKGLNLYLRKEYENLLTVEIICHGVPSPKVFREYIKKVEKEKNEKIEKIYFRNKDEGWKKFSYKVNFKNKDVMRETLDKNIFMRGFLRDLYLRESCYSCKAKGFSSKADIALADYWGVNEIHPEIDDDKGISLMIVNTRKGEEKINKIKGKITIIDTDRDHAIKHNKCIVGSVNENKNRNKFFEKIDSMDIEKNIEKNIKISFIKKIYIKLRGIGGKIKRSIT